MKCDKTTGKKIEYFINNPDEFDCKSCLTCKMCLKIVASNHRGILCDLCNNWAHAKCNKFEKSDFLEFQDNENPQFFSSENLPTLDPRTARITRTGNPHFTVKTFILFSFPNG